MKLSSNSGSVLSREATDQLSELTPIALDLKPYEYKFRIHSQFPSTPAGFLKADFSPNNINMDTMALDQHFITLPFLAFLFKNFHS